MRKNKAEKPKVHGASGDAAPRGRRRKILPSYLDVSKEKSKSLFSELYQKREFFDSLKEKIKLVNFEQNLLAIRQAELYIICRMLKPEVVIETGVENGISTSFILQALKDNDSGKLYSIELNQFLLEGRKSGWIVPRNLARRWCLLLGDSLELLPTLCEKLHSIDVFIHDSEHSYRTMFTEFSQAWFTIKRGGILLSDDTGQNEAFIKFSQKINLLPTWTDRGYGILKKS